MTNQRYTTNNYFIPHHAVRNPNSSTTKFRVVFDNYFLHEGLGFRVDSPVSKEGNIHSYELIFSTQNNLFILTISKNLVLSNSFQRSFKIYRKLLSSQTLWGLPICIFNFISNHVSYRSITKSAEDSFVISVTVGTALQATRDQVRSRIHFSILIMKFLCSGDPESQYADYAKCHLSIL